MTVTLSKLSNSLSRTTVTQAWIDGTSLHFSQPAISRGSTESSFANHLYATCLQVFTELSQELRKSRKSLSVSEALNQELGRLFLWGRGFSDGQLDTLLEQSDELRNIVLDLVSTIGKLLLKELVPLLPLTVLPNRLKQSLDDLELLIEQSRTITACDEDNDNEGSHFSDPSDEENVSAAEDDNAGKQEASIDENLRFYIKCLMDLVPTMEQTLQHVQTPHQPNVHPAQVLFSLSQPAQTYVMNVYDKFTRADTKLVERLGEANYQRHIIVRSRMEQIASSSGGDAEVEPIIDHMDSRAAPHSMFVPYSIFHDSGIGSSVRAQSQYAVSLASHTSFLSNNAEDENGSLRVPATPAKVGTGEPFQCEICGNLLYKIKNRVDWKIHVFVDLQPYICTSKECKDGLVKFPTRKLWADHEFNKHRVDRSWACPECSIELQTPVEWQTHVRYSHHTVFPDSQLRHALDSAERTRPQPMVHQDCPLCKVIPGSTRRAFVTHVARHMENIALAALPRMSNGDSENESCAMDAEDILASTSSSKPPSCIAIGDNGFSTSEAHIPRIIASLATGTNRPPSFRTSTEHHMTPNDKFDGNKWDQVVSKNLMLDKSTAKAIEQVQGITPDRSDNRRRDKTATTNRGVAQVNELLMQYGICPDDLSQSQLESFYKQSSHVQERSCQLYQRYLSLPMTPIQGSRIAQSTVSPEAKVPGLHDGNHAIVELGSIQRADSAGENSLQESQAEIQSTLKSANTHENGPQESPLRNMQIQSGLTEQQITEQVSIKDQEHSADYQTRLLFLAALYSAEQQVSGVSSPKSRERVVGTSSYWTVSEQEAFRQHLEVYGTDWQGIADIMPSKTQVMIKNYYSRLVESGKTEIERVADEADNRLEQAAYMDQLNYPSPDVPSHISTTIPGGTKTWGQLKAWISQNAASLPTDVLDRVKKLQRIHQHRLVSHSELAVNTPISDAYQQYKAQEPDLQHEQEVRLTGHRLDPAQTEGLLRPEKCPIVTCEYHQIGFRRRYDMYQHILTHFEGVMVCGFCPGSGSAAETSFNRADVFKRHLTSVHGVEQTHSTASKAISNYSTDQSGKCSTCAATFANAQLFYEHLYTCILHAVLQKDLSEAEAEAHQ